MGTLNTVMVFYRAFSAFEISLPANVSREAPYLDYSQFMASKGGDDATLLLLGKTYVFCSFEKHLITYCSVPLFLCFEKVA